MSQAEHVARACVPAADVCRARQAFLVVDDEPVRWRDLFTYIAREAGGPRPRYLPPAVARLAVGRLTADLLPAPLRRRNGKLKPPLGCAPRVPTYRPRLAPPPEALARP